MPTVLVRLMHVNETCNLANQSHASRPNPVSPIGLNVVVRQWRFIDRAWLRLL